MGKENTEKIFEHFDGGCIHLHQGNCRHLLKPASKIKGLKLIAIIDEGFNADKAYMHLED